MSRKCRAFSESKLGLEPADNRKAFYAGWEAALAKPEVQSTHSAECYKWHHECARAEVERLRAALAEPVQEPVGYWDGKFSDSGAAILYEVPQKSVFGFKYRNAPLYAAPAQQTLNTPEECEHKADGWYAVQRVAGVTRVWPMTEAQALRAALKQEEEASAWLAERKEYWRKEREKMQVTKDQDPELSAALGWPGGTSDPVLDRTRLLQMVAALRVASKQALDWLYENDILHPTKVSEALRAALAQQAEPVAVAERERIAAQWDGCVTHQLDTFGPVDIGASIRAGELVEPAQQVEPLINQCGETCERAKLCAVCASKLAEPVQMPAQEPYCHVYEYDSVFGLHRELYPREYNGRKPDRAVPLYTTPPQRTMVPLTEEEIDRIGMTHQSLRQVVRAVEKAVWEKNHE